MLFVVGVGCADYAYFPSRYRRRVVDAVLLFFLLLARAVFIVCIGVLMPADPSVCIVG